MCILCSYVVLPMALLLREHCFMQKTNALKYYSVNTFLMGFELMIKTRFVIHGRAHAHIFRTHDHAVV